MLFRSGKVLSELGRLQDSEKVSWATLKCMCRCKYLDCKICLRGVKLVVTIFWCFELAGQTSWFSNGTLESCQTKRRFLPKLNLLWKNDHFGYKRFSFTSAEVASSMCSRLISPTSSDKLYAPLVFQHITETNETLYFIFLQT